MLKALGFVLFAATLLATATAQQTIAIVNTTVIDGTDHAARRNATVVIEGSKILSITSQHHHVPANVSRIDGTGKFLIPGLWNNDLHGNLADGKAHFAELLAAGVTTIRDMGAPLDDILRLRSATASGEITGPRVFVAGPLLEGPTPVQMGLIVDLFSQQQAREEVRTLKEHGVDYVEVDTTLTPELYWAIADQAKRNGLRLVGHIPAKVSAWDMPKADQVNVEHLGGRFFNVLVACSSEQDYFMQQLAAASDSIMLSLADKKPLVEPQFKAAFAQRLLSTFDETKAQRLFQTYAAHHIVQTPTLHVLKTLWQTNQQQNHLDSQDMEAGNRIFAKDLEVVGKMKKDGVVILAGTDGPYQDGGPALHDELQLLIQAGLTPLEAIQAASRDAARAMGVDQEVGTIEVGKAADLLLLDADPLADIANTTKIESVILHGKVLTAADLKAH